MTNFMNRLFKFVLFITFSAFATAWANGQADTLDVPPPPPRIEEPPPTQAELEIAGSVVPVRVPGTKLSILPPPGFKLRKNATAFEKDALTSIIVMDLDGGNFYSNTATYTKEKFEGKGLEVMELEQLTVDGYPGIRAVIKNPIDGSISHQLVFGDTTFSALVVASVRGSDRSTSNAVRRALETVTYDKQVIVGMYEGTGFRMDDRSTELKFAKKGGGVWIYSRDWISKVRYGDDEPILMVLPVPFGAPYTCASLAEKMISSLEKKGFSGPRAQNASTKRVNGFDAYEVEYHGLMNGERTMVYMLVVVLGDQAVVLQGRSAEPFEGSLMMFKALAHTVSFQ